MSYSKADMQAAYEEGQRAKEHNDKIDKLLDEGTKQCPEKATFESWLPSYIDAKPINWKNVARKFREDGDFNMSNVKENEKANNH